MSPRPQKKASQLATALIEHSWDAIALLNEGGTVLYASPATARLVGRTIGDIMGTNVFKWVHEEDMETFTANFNRRLEQPGVAVRDEFRLRHSDDSWRHVESVGVNWLDIPSIRGIIVNYRDETDRKLAEAAVQEGEARFRQLIEHASDIIYNCDAKGCFTFFNATAVRLMKYSEEELLGRNYLSLIRQDYQKRARELYDGQITEGIESTYFEFPAIAKDGTEVWLGQNVQIVTAGDRITGVQAIARDITARRAREEQLRQAQKMEAIGRLAGSVAHDFNNVLAAILGSAEVLTEQLDPDDSRWAEADAIRRTAERGAEITRRLLEFSRPHVAAAGVLDLAAAARRMEPMLRRLVLDQIELVFTATGDPVLVKADESQIGQILMNLVVNARDALSSGGRVTVSVGAIAKAEPGAGRFGIGFGPCAKLSVLDTGEGMDAATQAHLFEPFFTTKPPEKGSGLGLSIVYGIVKNLGGLIEVQSERGQGTAFHIYLPPAVD